MFDHDWTMDNFRRIVESCIEIFTPERCMFGSNFPVDKLHKTYGEIWGAYEEIAQQYSDAEQELMFVGNAEAFYGLS